MSINQTKLQIGSLVLPNRLIQGPLAGFSCAPFREMFSLFSPPCYASSEMLSAQDVLTKHIPKHRYLYKSPNEGLVAYQLSGTCPSLMSDAAVKLEQLGADLIDINCGCPKPKIRKKGAGSALLENPDRLQAIITAIKNKINIPLTVKIRLQNPLSDKAIASMIENAGADALIVHGRTAKQDYHTICNYQAIADIKSHINIPVIANGDISHPASLGEAISQSKADAWMISRAGTGNPWLFAQLLGKRLPDFSLQDKIDWFITHLQGLAHLENEFKAVLQARTLVRYYFRQERQQLPYPAIFACQNISELKTCLSKYLGTC